MRLLELYTSIQGEGPNVGLPTTFVRFAGCNFRCRGWPCDTPYSIYPEIWTKEFRQVTPVELAKTLGGMYPHHVCITGGEPLLQPKEEMYDFLTELSLRGFTVDLFTNGSIDFEQVGLPPTSFSNLTVVMDWKLTGSGEGSTSTDIRQLNRTLLRSQDALKFVVVDIGDLEEMSRWLHVWEATLFHQVFVAPAWNRIDPSAVVEYIGMNDLHFVRLNLQIHKYIWEPTTRRI